MGRSGRNKIDIKQLRGSKIMEDLGVRSLKTRKGKRQIGASEAWKKDIDNAVENGVVSYRRTEGERGIRGAFPLSSKN